MNPLLVPELFQCVLDCLSMTPSRDSLSLEERRTLATLARTCSAFSEPCLDRLWRRLSSLVPLMQSFSSVVDVSIAQTCPSHHEWSTINRYVPRIQDLTLGDNLSLHFLEYTNLVLPNLRVLRWDPRLHAPTADRAKASRFPHIWPLLGPKIVSLEMKLDTFTDPEFQSLLKSHPLHCPNLQSIKLEFISFDDKTPTQITAVLFQAICNHADLQRVELFYAMDDVTLRHLGLHSTLKVASLTLVSEATQPSESCFEPSEVPFRDVTSLTLSVWGHLDVATDLLRPHDQAFHAFQVTFRNIHATAMDIHALLKATASSHRIHSLRSFTLSQPHFSFADSVSDETQMLSYETIRPVASLVHLRKLIIWSNLSITLDDEEFESLVCNWPNLEVLRLIGRCEEPTKMISFKGLLSLLVSCPKLRDIGLTLSALEVPFGDAYAGADVCRPLVTRLSVRDSPIHEPLLVKAFLRKHMPNLKDVNGWFFPITAFHRGHRQAWFEVGMYIRNL